MGISVRIIYQLLILLVGCQWSLVWAQGSFQTIKPITPENAGESVSYFYDESAELDAFELTQSNKSVVWQPVNSEVLNAGYTQTALWLRFRLDLNNSNESNWNLVFENALLDNVDAYQITPSGPQIIYSSGSSKPFQRRLVDHRYFVIPLKLNQPQEYLVRISSDLHLQGNFKIWPGATYWRHYQFADDFNWLFYGIVFSMMFYNLFLFAVVRDPSYLHFVGYISFYGLYMMMLDGYIFQSIWPSHQPWMHQALHIAVASSSVFTTAFVIGFLNLKTHFPLAYRILLVNAIFSVAITCFSLALPVATVSIVLMFTTTIGLITTITTSLYSYFKGFAPALYFSAAWAFFLVGSLGLLITKLGLLPATFFTLNMGKIGTAAEAILLSFALGYRIRTLRAQSIEDQSKAEARSQFLAQISHEIRTPMNGVVGMVELLAQTPLNREQKGYVSTIRQSGETLLNLINDTLDLSRLEAGRMPIEDVPLNLRTTTDHALEIFQVVANNKGLNLRLVFDDDVAHERVSDPKRIQQILINLISNAIKFTEKGNITVSIHALPNDWVHFEVEDQGIGIDPSVQENIFQSYQQAQTSTARKYGGTGLGLKICKELVELMEGEIGVKSAQGKGATFWFKIPMPVRAVESDGITSDQQLQLPQYMKVLVADDNSVNQVVIKGLLNKLGYDVDLVGDGNDAVNKVSHGELYDLILMDKEMPSMDGITAVKMIREYQRSFNKPHTKIFALTAHAMADTKKECLEAGMDDFLSKPINFQVLKDTLGRHFSDTSN